MPMIARSLMCFALLLPGVVSAEDGSGSCAASTTSEPSASVVSVPDYQSDDTSEEARSTAFERDYQAYQDELVRNLTASSDPRDWALAATGFHFGPDANSAEHLKQLQRAVNAAPDDVLVLWMAVNGSRDQSDGKLSTSALEKLKTADADNGAVWLETLSIAAHKHDHAGASAALKRLSATSRFDNHFVEMSDAIITAYHRYPMSDSLYAEMPDEMKSVSKDAMPLIYATTITSAFALPAFQSLTNACRTDGKGRNADRAGDCQMIGRMMVANSDTLIGTAIGSAVLRMSRTFDDDDIAAARDTSWVRMQYATMVGNAAPSADLLAAQIAFHQDWLESNSETQAMRKGIERAGISGHPPKDWVDSGSRFTSEVMAADENYFADHPIDY